MENKIKIKIIDGELWEKVQLIEDYTQTKSIRVENDNYIFTFTSIYNNSGEYFEDGILEINKNNREEEFVDLWDNILYLKYILENFDTINYNSFFEENKVEIYSVLKIAQNKGWI